MASHRQTPTNTSNTRLSRWILFATHLFAAAAPSAFARRRVHHGTSFIPSISASRSKTSSWTSRIYSSAKDWNESLEKRIQKQKNAALVEALVCPTGEDSLTDIFLVGRGSIRTAQNDTVQCLMLSMDNSRGTNTIKSTLSSDSAGSACLVLPLSTSASTAQLKLLSFAYAGKAISKSVCLGLNSLLVNRDDALFDQLPWSQWSVDPQRRNRDAAGNVIDPKYHLGKRDAYNRFMGKDWQGRSLSLGNLALRLKYQLDEEDDDSDNKKNNKVAKLDDSGIMFEEESKSALAKRILQLQIRELQMEIAEVDYELAVARTNQLDILAQLEHSRKELEQKSKEAENALTLLQQTELQLENGKGTASDTEPFYISLLNKVVDWSTDNGKNEAPYRGAMGYAPSLDTKEYIENGLLPYTSPYDLMKEIIEDQLNADVIGSILENTSLFDDGTIVLGGAIILRRKGKEKTLKLFGEERTIMDEDEDFGNEDGRGGETMVVECDTYEAIGMALSCNIPISVEESVLERSSLLASATKISPEDEKTKADTKGIMESIPLWELNDKNVIFLVEGQGRNVTTMPAETPPSTLRVPKTTLSLYDSLFEQKSSSLISSSTSSTSYVFPTDNPVKSLSEYDALSNSEKAQTLLSLSNFQGKLPRPRVLREAEMKQSKQKSSNRQKSDSMNPLDKILLPLIDESVRRQYLIRDAETRGDREEVERLMANRSRRQVAMESADIARLTNNAVGTSSDDDDFNDETKFWENEKNIYDNLRADVTQDEGSYSRFLDKDEWYERDRQARAKNVKKSDFGTLLDGIE